MLLPPGVQLTCLAQVATQILPVLNRLGACENGCWIWPSITQNCYQTAEIIAYQFDIGRSRIVPEYSFLDARGVGSYEGRPLPEVALLLRQGDSLDRMWKPPKGLRICPSRRRGYRASPAQCCSHQAHFPLTALPARPYHGWPQQQRLQLTQQPSRGSAAGPGCRPSLPGGCLPGSEHERTSHLRQPSFRPWQHPGAATGSPTAAAAGATVATLLVARVALCIRCPSPVVACDQLTPGLSCRGCKASCLLLNVSLRVGGRVDG